MRLTCSKDDVGSPPDESESCDTKGPQQRQRNHNLLVSEPRLARHLVHLGLHKRIERLGVDLHDSTAGAQQQLRESLSII